MFERWILKIYLELIEGKGEEDSNSLPATHPNSRVSQSSGGIEQQKPCGRVWGWLSSWAWHWWLTVYLQLQNETGVLGHHYNRENKRKRNSKPLLRPKFGNKMWGQGSDGEDQHHKWWHKNIFPWSVLPIQVQTKEDSPQPPAVPLSQHHPSLGSPGFSTSKMT